jgi:hypothetical protein
LHQGCEEFGEEGDDIKAHAASIFAKLYAR